MWGWVHCWMPQPRSDCDVDQMPLTGCTGRAWGRCVRSPFALQKPVCAPLDVLQGKQGARRLHCPGAGLVAAAPCVTKLQKLQRLQVLPGSLCPLGLLPPRSCTFRCVGLRRTSCGLFVPCCPLLSQIPGTAQTRMDKGCPLCPLCPLQKKRVAEFCAVLRWAIA